MAWRKGREVAIIGGAYPIFRKVFSSLTLLFHEMNIILMSILLVLPSGVLNVLLLRLSSVVLHLRFSCYASVCLRGYAVYPVQEFKNDLGKTRRHTWVPGILPRLIIP
jgi:hypothetical protein